MKPCLVRFLLIFFLVYPLCQPSNCQQSYQENIQLGCDQGSSETTKLYLCYGSVDTQTVCQSFVTFRSRPPYNSLISIANLFGSGPSNIALINNISSYSAIIPSETIVIVPIPCSCSAGVHQYNASYKILTSTETYFSVANNTFQGLSTCQAALADQNNNNDGNNAVGSNLIVPVRCACPTANQIANGVSSLLSYILTWNDSVTSIADTFDVDETSILEANMLSRNSTIYPFTSLLVPMKNKNCSRNQAKMFCSCANCSLTQDPHFNPDDQKFPVKLVTILGISGLGILGVSISGYILFRVLRNRRQKMRKEKLFKQNGGLLLQQRLTLHGSSEKTKVFSVEELESATENYNQSRFLGQGGFGTVYKGMLPDGRIVAVKRSKAVDKNQIEQFINEVVILSQIDHRHIVKLLGCCFETEVPVLVYEFISNGTLSDHIRDHEQGQESSLSWDDRVRISCEVAGAVAYMHSAASIPIFHRDIKSSNVLLDEKYRAKVSDFGTSRYIPNDKTHLTTAVQGTFGYLDPEYFQSSQFTEKSDVYSFGVVLVELLTGKTPVSYARAEEKNLVACFISLAKENQLLEILDPRVAKEAMEEDIRSIAELAMACLRLNGKKRPTMKEVATELEGLIRSQSSLEIYQEPLEMRDEMLYMETSEETAQGSTEESLEFSLQM